jgi:hypothetical protein
VPFLIAHVNEKLLLFLLFMQRPSSDDSSNMTSPPSSEIISASLDMTDLVDEDVDGRSLWHGSAGMSMERSDLDDIAADDNSMVLLLLLWSLNVSSLFLFLWSVIDRPFITGPLFVWSFNARPFITGSIIAWPCDVRFLLGLERLSFPRLLALQWLAEPA